MGPATRARADECLDGGGDARPNSNLVHARLGAGEPLVGQHEDLRGRSGVEIAVPQCGHLSSPCHCPG